MTATERLRALLDERGVEWDYGITGSTTTRFSVNGIDLTFTPMRDGLVCSTILTPEQAIAATLGKEPDDTAMLKLHDRMNAALLEYERALGGKKADGAITVPFVAKMHHLLEEAATLGSCSDSYSCTNDCTNGERTGERTDIAATLEVIDARQVQAESSGTCHAAETDHYRVRTEGTGCPLTVRIMECSKCGGIYGYVTGGYEYCPRCGRKVVDPMTNDVDMEVDDD